MAVIKKKELSSMSQEDIRKRIEEFRLEMSKIKSQINVGGAASNPSRIRGLRRTIAKMLTEINKRKGGVKTG